MKYIVLAIGCGFVILVSAAAATEPVAMRMESFLVSPSHTPSAVVVVRNLQPNPYQGTIRVSGPDGWQFDPQEKSVDLDGDATQRVSFLVRRAAGREDNAYPLVMTAEGTGSTVKRAQTVMAASAPYFKPEIDGKIEDWKDAIPVAWNSNGKRTVIRTYWNRRRFALLVEVEEDKLCPPSPAFDKHGDAIQFALASEDARTGDSPDLTSERYEFLVMASGNGLPGTCIQLAEPGMVLSEGQQPRDLTSLRYEDAEVAVRRAGSITYYECSIPFRPMREQIRPSEGREFAFSVLVHDPDGTGLRDWGAGAELWPSERNRLAWSTWQGAKWEAAPPFDNKIPWGLCSSKY